MSNLTSKLTILVCSASVLALSACGSSNGNRPPDGTQTPMEVETSEPRNVNFEQASVFKAEIDQLVEAAEAVSGETVAFVSRNGRANAGQDTFPSQSLARLQQIKREANIALEGVRVFENVATDAEGATANPAAVAQTRAALESITNLLYEARGIARQPRSGDVTKGSDSTRRDFLIEEGGKITTEAALEAIETNRPLRVEDGGRKLTYGSASIVISGEDVNEIRDIRETRSAQSSPTGGLNPKTFPFTKNVGAQYNSGNNRQTVAIIDTEHVLSEERKTVFQHAFPTGVGHVEFLAGTGERTSRTGAIDGRLRKLTDQIPADQAGNILDADDIFRLTRDGLSEIWYQRDGNVSPDGYQTYRVVTPIPNVSFPTSSARPYEHMNFGVWADRNVNAGPERVTSRGTGFVRTINDSELTPVSVLDVLSNQSLSTGGDATYNGSWVATVTNRAGNDTRILNDRAEIEANFGSNSITADLHNLGNLSGVINGNTFRATEVEAFVPDATAPDGLRGIAPRDFTATMAGGVYGPDADEVGGVFSINSNIDGAGADGAFGGARD